MTAVASRHTRDLLAALKKVKPSGDGWLARCPAHEDGEPSLKVDEATDGRVLLRCYAGCSVKAIVAAMGLTMADLYPPREPDIFTTPAPRSAASAPAAPPPVPPEPPRDDDASEVPDKASWPVVASYDYADADGALAYRVLRKEPPGGGRKTFVQGKVTAAGAFVAGLNGAPRLLYRLPELVEDVAAERPVLLVEGEKDVETARSLGFPATTHCGGANNWRPEYAEPLAGATVVILPDNDAPGREWAAKAGADLAAAGARVKMLPLPNVGDKGDLTDWVEAGGTVEQLENLLATARTWTPGEPVPAPGERPTRFRLDELWANDAVMRPPPPVVPRLAWAGRSTMLAAAEKAGKSTLTGYVAACVSRGSPFLDEPCNSGERGTVLVFGLEEFIGDAARRLRHFGADATRVFLVDRLPNDPRARLAALRSHVEAVTPALVVIDTLIAYGDGAVSDAGASAQMGPMVTQLTAVAHDTGAAVVIVHHARKADGRYRDSSAIGAAVDVIAEVFAPGETEDTDPALRKVRVRGRVPVHDFSFRFDGETYRLASGPSAPLDQRIAEFVRANPGCSIRAVRAGVGGKASEIDEMLTRLLAAGRLLDDGTSAARAYRLPTQGPHASTPEGQSPYGPRSGHARDTGWTR